MHYIEREVIKLIEKYHTRDPFEICDRQKIECKLQKLHPEINGIYQYVDMNKYIYINKSLTKSKQLTTCLHELGHATLHEKYNCTFFQTNTHFNMNRFEREAEFFAACFLVPGITAISCYKDCSLVDISYELDVPLKYLKLRLDYSGGI